MAVKPSTPVAQRNHPFFTNLLRAYMFTEGTGTTVKDYANDNTATISLGTGGVNPAWEFSGTEGQLLRFEAGVGNPGYNAHLNDPVSIGSELTNIITVLARVRIDTFTINKNFIRQASSDGDISPAWTLRTSSSTNRISFNIRSGATLLGGAPSFTIIPGQFHSLAGRYNGSNIKAFVDGQNDFSTNHSSNILDPSDTVRIAQGTSTPLAITFSAVFIWNRALTAQEIVDYSNDPYTGIWVSVGRNAVQGHLMPTIIYGSAARKITFPREFNVYTATRTARITKQVSTDGTPYALKFNQKQAIILEKKT